MLWSGLDDTSTYLKFHSLSFDHCLAADWLTMLASLLLPQVVQWTSTHLCIRNQGSMKWKRQSFCSICRSCGACTSMHWFEQKKHPCSVLSHSLDNPVVIQSIQLIFWTTVALLIPLVACAAESPSFHQLTIWDWAHDNCHPQQLLSIFQSKRLWIVLELAATGRIGYLRSFCLIRNPLCLWTLLKRTQ